MPELPGLKLKKLQLKRVVFTIGLIAGKACLKQTRSRIRLGGGIRLSERSPGCRPEKNESGEEGSNVQETWHGCTLSGNAVRVPRLFHGKRCRRPGRWCECSARSNPQIEYNSRHFRRATRCFSAAG